MNSKFVVSKGVSVATRDIGEGGAYVDWTPGTYSPGDSADLKFQLGGESFSLGAGIVRIDDDQAPGVAFRDLEADDRYRLRKALAKEMAVQASSS